MTTVSDVAASVPIGDSPSVAFLRAPDEQDIESVWIDEVNQTVIGCDGDGAGIAVTLGTFDWADGARWQRFAPTPLETPSTFDPDITGDQGCPRNVRPFDRGSKHAIVDAKLRVFESTRGVLTFHRPEWVPYMGVENHPLTEGARDEAVLVSVQEEGLAYVVDIDWRDNNVGRGLPDPIALEDGRRYLDLAVSPSGRWFAVLSIADDATIETAEDVEIQLYNLDRSTQQVVPAGAPRVISSEGFLDILERFGPLKRSAPWWLVLDDDASIVVGTRRTFASLSANGDLSILDARFSLAQRYGSNLARPRLLEGRRLAFSSGIAHLPDDEFPVVPDEVYIYSLRDHSFSRVPSPTSAAERFGVAADGRAVAFADRQVASVAAALVTDALDDLVLDTQGADQVVVAGQPTVISVPVHNRGRWSVPLDDIEIDLGPFGRASCGPTAVPPGETVYCDAEVNSAQAGRATAFVVVVQWGATRRLGVLGDVEFVRGPSAPGSVHIEQHANGGWRISWDEPDWRGANTRREYRVQLFYGEFATGITCGPAGDANGWFDIGLLREVGGRPEVDCGALGPREYEILVEARTPFGESAARLLTFTVPDPALPPVDPPPSTVPPEPQNPCGGYQIFSAGGAIYSFGPMAQQAFSAPVVAAGEQLVSVALTGDGDGRYLLYTDGRVVAQGSASHHGDADVSVFAAGETVSSLAARPDGSGYWVFTNRGRVLVFGDAVHHGDLLTLALNGEVISSTPTPSGKGYFLVAADGGVFAFGDAVFAGSMGGTVLNEPVVGLAPDPDGSGYWLVAADGGVFAFDAEFLGSMGGVPLVRPVVGAVASGSGYYMVAADGGVFAFGVPFDGSIGGNPLSDPVLGLAAPTC